MRKLTCALLISLCLLSTVSCGKKQESQLSKGELSFSAVNTKSGFEPSSVMDDDLTVGWIGSKKATESNFQVFNIDLVK